MRPRKADFALLAGIERTRRDPFDVAGAVNAGEVRVACDRRFVQDDVAQLRFHTLPQQTVLLHREPVAGGKR
jgi:hypothetical protein